METTGHAFQNQDTANLHALLDFFARDIQDFLASTTQEELRQITEQTQAAATARMAEERRRRLPPTPGLVSKDFESDNLLNLVKIILLRILSQDIGILKNELAEQDRTGNDLITARYNAIQTLLNKYVVKGTQGEFILNTDIVSQLRPILEGLPLPGNFTEILPRLLGYTTFEGAKQALTAPPPLRTDTDGNILIEDIIPIISHYLEKIYDTETLDAVDGWLTKLQAYLMGRTRQPDFNSQLTRVLDPIVREAVGSLWATGAKIGFAFRWALPKFILPKLSKLLGIPLKDLNITASSPTELIQKIIPVFIGKLRSTIAEQKKFAELAAQGNGIEVAFRRSFDLFERLERLRVAKRTPDEKEKAMLDSLSKEITGLDIDIDTLRGQPREEMVRTILQPAIDYAISKIPPRVYENFLEQIMKLAIEKLAKEDVSDRDIDETKRAIIETAQTIARKEVTAETELSTFGVVTLQEIVTNITRISDVTTDRLIAEHDALAEIQRLLQNFNRLINEPAAPSADRQINIEAGTIRRPTVKETRKGFTQLEADVARQLEPLANSPMKTAITDTMAATVKSLQEASEKEAPPPEIQPGSAWFSRRAITAYSGLAGAGVATLVTGGLAAPFVGAVILGGGGYLGKGYYDSTQAEKPIDEATVATITAKLTHLEEETTRLIQQNGELQQSANALRRNAEQAITSIQAAEQHKREGKLIEQFRLLKTELEEFQTKLAKYDNSVFKWAHGLLAFFGIKTSGYKLSEKRDKIDESTGIIAKYLADRAPAAEAVPPAADAAAPAPGAAQAPPAPVPPPAPRVLKDETLDEGKIKQAEAAKGEAEQLEEEVKRIGDYINPGRRKKPAVRP